LDDEDFAVSNYEWFFEDIAGMEGLNWLSISILLFIFVLGPIAIGFGVIRGLWRVIYMRRRRLEESRAAVQDAVHNATVDAGRCMVAGESQVRSY
jgi:hypothetical protein